MYRLPPKYHSQTPKDFDDTTPPTTGPGSWVWQPDVVPFTVDFARLGGVHRVLDIGCGSGRKWAGIADLEVIGFDRAEIVAAVTDIVAWPVDLESAATIPHADGSLLLCSDVIEHMVDPIPLLRTLRQTLDDGAVALVLSTPDRVLTRGSRHLGPPPNQYHAREWALDELCSLLTDHGFTIEHAGHTRSNDHEPAEATCLVVAT